MQSGDNSYPLPELMAPVSDLQMLAAAIHNGAGAVYIGAPDFNARGRADTLNLEEIKEMTETAHTRGVRVYIALNVLIFEDELPRVLELYRRLCSANPDAFIVQDAGLARLIREIDPGARLHASTQMTIAGSGDVAFYSDLNFSRYTLSRELTLQEVSEVRRKRAEELEVFVHGSLCIAYSGQCFTSAGFGGRSANRGECAQSCRHEYRLVGDLPAKNGYLVSPMDLCAKEQVQELAEMGVNALKIEGRLKSPEYVSAALRLYRSLLRREDDTQSHEVETALTFHRGLYSGWLGGIDHTKLVNPQINSHLGLQIGEIKEIRRHTLTVRLTGLARRVPIRAGDGVFMEEIRAGGPLYAIHPAGKDGASSARGRNQKAAPPSLKEGKELPSLVEMTLGKEFPAHRLRPGMAVYLTSCQAVRKELKRSYGDKERFKKIPVRAVLTGEIGKPLCLTLGDHTHSVEAFSEGPLETALNRGLTEPFLRQELGSLGATPFEIETLEIKVPSLNQTFLSHGMIKALRKEAAEALLQARLKSMGRVSLPAREAILPAIERLRRRANEAPAAGPKLYLLLRRPEQVSALETLSGLVAGVYLDFTYGREYAPAIKLARSYGVPVFLATERVMKDDPGAHKRLLSLAALEPDLLLVRNGASAEAICGLKTGKEISMAADFSFNATNSSTAAYLLQKGFERITASYDLIFDQGNSRVDISRLLLLLEAAPAGQVEVCLSYYLPAFYMEYCLFAAHYGKGGTLSTCWLPCKKHELALQDRKGEVHPVLADQGCRNIMYNNRPREIFSFLPQLLKAGARDFRIEFLSETPEEIVKKTGLAAEKIL